MPTRRRWPGLVLVVAALAARSHTTFRPLESRLCLRSATFVPPAGRAKGTPARQPPSHCATVRRAGAAPGGNKDEDDGPLKWLEATWRTAADFYLARRLDLNVAGSLVAGVFNSYVLAAEPAHFPDCTSYSPEGACCPSLACYRSMPFGVKTFVTVYLTLGIFGCLRTVAATGSSNTEVVVKLLFIAGVQASIILTLNGS